MLKAMALLLRVLFGSALVALAFSAAVADAQKLTAKIELQSSAFAAGTEIPALYSCSGPDKSPPLSWKGTPSSGKSLALIVDDPDAPGGVFVHWVLYNLPISL